MFRRIVILLALVLCGMEMVEKIVSQQQPLRLHYQIPTKTNHQVNKLESIVTVKALRLSPIVHPILPLLKSTAISLVYLSIHLEDVLPDRHLVGSKLDSFQIQPKLGVGTRAQRGLKESRINIKV
jgi:hypothetical protein